VHPSVKAYDETLTFQWTVKSKLLRKGDPSRHNHRLLNVLRREYVACLLQDDVICSRGKFLVDKNPSLTAFLPVWLKIFPELKVIIALRDPRDVIISCYFQNIPLNYINANFLSLDRLARHYSDLMSIWLMVREWKDFAWIETRYEDIVANLEAEGRRVTGFLGLDWHQDQAYFYKHYGKHRVNSPTYHNVTQPLYSRSIARWHAYERHLSPVQKVVEPFCSAFGYS
jgi:Sulfotransferase family